MAEKKFKGLAIAFATAFIFGIYIPAARAVYNDGGNPIFVIMVTACARALGLVGFCIYSRIPLFQTKGSIKKGFLGGFFQASSIMCFFAAISSLSGTLAISVFMTSPLILFFFLVWKGERHFDIWTIVVSAVALVGLCVLLDVWNVKELSFIGLGLAFLSSLANVGRLYVFGKQTQNGHPIAVGAEAFIFMALLALCLPFFQAPIAPTSFAGYAWTLVCVLSLVIGSFGTFYAMSILGSFEYGLTCKLEPVSAAIFSALFINEILYSHQYIGMVILLGSLVAYQFIAPRAENNA